MAITQTIATLPAVLNDSATFYEDIAVRNNSLVTTVLPSINAWAIQANTTQAEINAKAEQVAAQAVDGGYSQTYINTNFVGVNNAQTIAGVKTFSANPISSAAQSSSVNALTRRDFVTTLDAENIKLSGNQTIAGVKTFSSSPIVPTPTTGTQAVNKAYVDNSAIGVGQTWQDVTAQRAIDTVYTNTTGRAIMVSVICFSGYSVNLFVDGVRVSALRNGLGNSLIDSTIQALVPLGSTYRLSQSANAVTPGFANWLELR